MSAEIQRVLGAVAGFFHLVFHCVYFLYRRLSGITDGWSTDHKIWEVSKRQLELM